MPIVKEIGKHNVFSMVSAKEKHRTPCVSKFSAKGSTKPQPPERGGGRIRAWDPRFSRPAPRRLRLVERGGGREGGEGKKCRKGRFSGVGGRWLPVLFFISHFNTCTTLSVFSRLILGA